MKQHPSHHDAAHDASHGSIKSYSIGFALSLILTFASFGVVMSGLVPHELRLTAIVALALVQLLVQLIYFLHMGTAKGQRENTAVFGVTAVLIAIVVASSLWVMHNANENMMPMQMSPEQARAHE
jgi:cytochrome o ubiquinol oxidase operon protein cyoD